MFRSLKRSSNLAWIGLSTIFWFMSSQVHDVVRADEPPNFIVIFADDQGYGDLGSFGSTKIKTPHLDRLAAEGRRYTSFYTASSVCSPSRTAPLTGCYPKRVGMHKHVLFPQSDYGLSPSETTIADFLKSKGYATACVGKWHLGHHKEILPTANGFDSYYGIPYSNDMNHPDNAGKPRMESDKLWKNPQSAITAWNTPLMQDETIVELPVDQRTITRRYTDRAIEFVSENVDRPFFLYLPHSMPHIPLYVPDDVYDPNPANAYTCVIEHIDAEVGRLMDTVRELGIDQSTYVIYTSDNGPWLRFKNHGGSAGPLRDGKGTTFEGGQRVPCIMWAPGHIPAGTSTDAFVTTMDVLPTIMSLVDPDATLDRPIDGMNIASTFDSDTSPRNELVYYSAQGALEGIRIGDWKYLEVPIGGRNQKQGKASSQQFLFDLSEDIGEQNNRLEERPDLVEQMKRRMTAMDQEITAGARSVWRTSDRDDTKD